MISRKKYSTRKSLPVKPVNLLQQTHSHTLKTDMAPGGKLIG